MKPTIAPLIASKIHFTKKKE